MVYLSEDNTHPDSNHSMAAQPGVGPRDRKSNVLTVTKPNHQRIRSYYQETRYSRQTIKSSRNMPIRPYKMTYISHKRKLTKLLREYSAENYAIYVKVVKKTDETVTAD